MSDETMTDSGWNTEDLESRRERWSLSLSDEERALVRADVRKGVWSTAEPVRAKLDAFVRASSRDTGFALVRNLTDPSDAQHESESVLRFLTAGFGEIIPQNADGDLVQVLRDRDGDGATELGFHCDTCDVLVLLCLQPAVLGGGFTKLASAKTIRDTVAAERPDILAVLEQDWYFDRTGRAGPQVIVSPILFTQKDGATGCYYQTRTVRTSPERGGPPLSDRQWEALDVLDEVLYRPEIAFSLLLEAGDLLLIRNSRVLHGRSAYVDVPPPRSRRVMRAWMRSEVL